MTAAASQAERFHRARVEFEEALAAGCTIMALRARKAALRRRARADVAEHTADLMAGAAPAQGDFLAWDAPHMMRD